MYGEGRYVGDEAAQWFSSYLNKPGCKMYQLSQPRVICEDEKWGDVGRPGDKVQLDINSFLRAVYNNECCKPNTKLNTYQLDYSANLKP